MRVKLGILNKDRVFRALEIGMPEEHAIRRSSRLILLDPEGRLLLFRYHDEHKPPFWSTVGGELKPGEDYQAAAERELEEETGFDFPIGPMIREREDIYAVARSRPAKWSERYFLVKCDHPHEPSRDGWTNEELATIQNWKWWKLEDMRSGGATFLPEWLPDLLEETLQQFVSTQPR